jgi:hypothetical protein
MNRHRAGVLSLEGCPLVHSILSPLPSRPQGFGMLPGLSSFSDTSPWSTRYSYVLPKFVPTSRGYPPVPKPFRARRHPPGWIVYR